VHWKQKGLFHNIDGVVDPGGNTLRQMNRLVDEVPEPGKARVFTQTEEILAAYPVYKDILEHAGIGTMLVEMTYFDIASDELKPAHKDAIFTANLKAFNKNYRVIWAWGFHSHTGEASFNLALAERRAEHAVQYARRLGIIDSQIRQWKYTGVPWRKGMLDGETGEMRRVHIIFRAESTVDPWSSGPPATAGFVGTTKTKYS
jgi:hypothetical protein